MSIKDFTEKIKLNLASIKDKAYSPENGLKIKEDLYIVLLIILVGTASYGLGKISSYEKNKTPIAVLKTKDAMYATVLDSNPNNANLKIINTSVNTSSAGLVVASKSGTKYYYPWCTGVSRINEENKVWFNTIEEAKSAGLTPASNCTGLK
jgi:hypothetical protein